MVFDGDRLTAQLDAESLLNFDSDNDTYIGTRNTNYVEFLSGHSPSTNHISGTEFNHYKSNNNDMPGFRNKIVYQKKNNLVDYLRTQSISNKFSELTLVDNPYLAELGFEDFSTLDLLGDDVSERQSANLLDIDGDTGQIVNSRATDMFNYTYTQNSGYLTAEHNIVSFSLLGYAEVDEIFSYLTPHTVAYSNQSGDFPFFGLVILLKNLVFVAVNLSKSILSVLSEFAQHYKSELLDVNTTFFDPELFIGHLYYCIVIGARFLFPYFYTHMNAFNGGYYLRSYRLDSYYSELSDSLIPT